MLFVLFLVLLLLFRLLLLLLLGGGDASICGGRPPSFGRLRAMLKNSLVLFSAMVIDDRWVLASGVNEAFVDLSM